MITNIANDARYAKEGVERKENEDRAELMRYGADRRVEYAKRIRRLRGQPRLAPRHSRTRRTA
jgi:hypothetical protein